MAGKGEDYAKTENLMEEERAMILQEQDDDKATGKVRLRSCTDVCCLMVFITFLCGMGHVWVAAHETGNLKKLTSGFDWRGHICGVDADVEHLPLLFWCVKSDGDSGSGGFTLTDGVCVEHCPTGDSTTHMCPDAPDFYDRVTTSGNTQLVTVGVDRTLRRQTDYATMQLSGLGYCFPDPGVNGFDDIMNLIANQTELGSNGRGLMTMAHGVAQSWDFLLGCLVSAIVMGYLFLFLLKTFIKPFVYTLGAILLAAVVCGGGVILYSAWSPQYNFFYHLTQDADQAKLYAQIAGGVVLALSIPLTCLLMSAKHAIEVTVQCVRESCSLLVQLPTLLLQPITQLAVKSVLLVFLLYGLLWAISMGDVRPDRQIDPLNPEGWDDMQMSGFSRGIFLTREQTFMVLYWALGVFWILEVITASGSFALSHAVVLFKTQGHTHYLPLLRGYFNAFAFHLGTLAFGGFIIGVLKLLTIVVAFLAKQLRNPDGSENKVAKCCVCCCLACLNCVTHLMEYINEMVYTECAIHGCGYLSASRHAITRLTTNPVVFAVVKGTTTFVSLLGMGIMTTGGTFIVYKIQFSNWASVIAHAAAQAGAAASEATGVESLTINPDNISGQMMSQSALGTTIASAVIFFYVSECFMQVFDHTANSLAYVILWLREQPGGKDKYPEPSSWSTAKKLHGGEGEEPQEAPYTELG